MSVPMPKIMKNFKHVKGLTCASLYPGSGTRKIFAIFDIRDPGSGIRKKISRSDIRDPKKISNIRYPGSGIRRNEKYSQIILNFLVENCLYYIVTMLALIPCLYGYFCDEKYSTKITSAKYLWFSNRISQMILWFWKLSVQPLTLPIEITLGEGWWLWLPGETLSPESILFTYTAISQFSV